jgi:hypothetical protein
MADGRKVMAKEEEDRESTPKMFALRRRGVRIHEELGIHMCWRRLRHSRVHCICSHAWSLLQAGKSAEAFDLGAAKGDAEFAVHFFAHLADVEVKVWTPNSPPPTHTPRAVDTSEGVLYRTSGATCAWVGVCVWRVA